jgi:hypothetical protein
MGDDWASKMAERLKEQEEQKRRNDEYDMRAAGLLSSHAPMLWEDLKTAIKTKADDLNSAYGSSYLTVSPLVQHREDLEVESRNAHLRLVFNSGVPAVSHKTTKVANGPWGGRQQEPGDLLLVVDRAQVWFIKKGESGTYKSVDQAAEYLLGMVLV